MNILLWTDMEGISQITDHRECWPVYPEYWQTGRRKYTRDAIAAASGLLEGGATEVFVVNGHGLGWPNLLSEEFPKRVRVFEDSDKRTRIDALFQVGFHSRCGTADGFISHTFVPCFRVSVNDALITEGHAVGWRVRVPVLGVVGDAALGKQLDGGLTGTPFLEVKRSTSRTETKPLHANPGASLDAIRVFASHCIRESCQLKPPVLPSLFTVAVSLEPDLANLVVGKNGLARPSPAVLTCQARDWRHDAEPAIGQAMGVAETPILNVIGDLYLSSEEAMRRQAPASLERLRRYFVEWTGGNSAAWED